MDSHQLDWIQHAVGEGWDAAQYPVIWAAVDLLDAAWRDAPEYVGLGGRGSDQDGKYDAVDEFLRHAIGRVPNFHPHCIAGQRQRHFHGRTPPFRVVARSRPARVAGRG